MPTWQRVSDLITWPISAWTLPLRLGHDLLWWSVYCDLITLPLFLQDSPKPLQGVVIAVSKKLSSRQGEYNNIAASLGAEYRWTYDNSCTHFIFRVRLDPSYDNAPPQGPVLHCGLCLAPWHPNSASSAITVFPIVSLVVVASFFRVASVLGHFTCQINRRIAAFLCILYHQTKRIGVMHMSDLHQEQPFVT